MYSGVARGPHDFLPYQSHIYSHSLTDASSKKTVKLANKHEESIPTLNNDDANAVSGEKAHLLNALLSNCMLEPCMPSLLCLNLSVFKMKAALITSSVYITDKIIELVNNLNN